MENNTPLNVEVTSDRGAKLWIKNVVSHTEQEIRMSDINNQRITLIDSDGTSVDVDLSKSFTVRYQDSESFERRVKEANDDATDSKGRKSHGRK